MSWQAKRYTRRSRYEGAKDETLTSIILFLHGESYKKGAWWVSTNGLEADAVAIPKSLAMFDAQDGLGGLERMDMRTCQRKLVTLYEFELPAFLIVEKGLMRRKPFAPLPAVREKRRAS